MNTGKPVELPPEAELIGRLRADDESALELLVAAYWQRLARFDRWGVQVLRALEYFVTPGAWGNVCLDRTPLVDDDNTTTKLIEVWERILWRWFDPDEGTQLDLAGICTFLQPMLSPGLEDSCDRERFGELFAHVDSLKRRRGE